MADDNAADAGTTGDQGITTTTTSTADTGQQAAPAGDAKFSQADLDRIVADRVARERGKYADYGDLKKRAAAAMTEQERAVAEAKQAGAAEAQMKTAARLAQAEIRAAAAGRVPPEALAGFLEYADVTKFLGADGEPDGKAIEAAVKRLAVPARQTDFDGGARTSAGKPTNMNDVIRQAAGYR